LKLFSKKKKINKKQKQIPHPPPKKRAKTSTTNNIFINHPFSSLVPFLKKRACLCEEEKFSFFPSPILCCFLVYD